MLMNLWVRDKTDGSIHQIGTDPHDSLNLLHGKVEYYNLQNSCGTVEGGSYEFIEAPDYDDYVVVTPDILRLNRELIHKDIFKMLKENGAFEDD